MNWSCNKYYFSLYLYCNKSSLVDPWSDDQGTNDDDKVPSEEVSQELLAEMTGKGMNWVPTTNDKKRMKNALNDTIRSRCDSREEHHYHLHQMKSYMESYGQEYMKEIVVRRADGEYKSFTELNYKYLHKNDIEDISCVIWKRVHEFQLGLESYQVKVNFTAPKLISPGIKEKKPYTSTSLPFVRLIYEYSKKEKRIMDIDEIPKFCDVTLKRVLKEMKKINLDVKHGYVDPSLSKDDAKFMVFNEKYIEERLRHRDQMRRWESYANGRLLRQRWERQE
ncbi:hypothetical protein Tco_0314033 [Tanacetum coccineum]